jgi:endonuclease YncB( thermonuclease family)
VANPAEWERLVSGAAVASGLALAVCAAVFPAAAAPASCQPGAGAETTGIAEVLAGDSVRLADGRVVRLAGIEVPPPPLDADDATGWPPAAAARHALAVLAGTTNVTVSLAEPDRYGRWRGSIYAGAGNRWVQSALVAMGLARVHRLPGDPKCVGALLDVESRARQANVGLWEDSAGFREASDASLNASEGLYELVEGRIASVGHGTSMIFLDFGREYRSDFTVMIPQAMADRLADTGIAVDGLSGRRVLVRGVIEESGGPAIRLSDPAEIEVLDDERD